MLAYRFQASADRPNQAPLMRFIPLQCSLATLRYPVLPTSGQPRFDVSFRPIHWTWGPERRPCGFSPDAVARSPVGPATGAARRESCIARIDQAVFRYPRSGDSRGLAGTEPGGTHGVAPFAVLLLPAGVGMFPFRSAPLAVRPTAHLALFRRGIDRPESGAPPLVSGLATTRRT